MEAAILVATVGATLPQLVHTISTQSTGDFHYTYILASLFANILLLVHGYRIKDRIIILLSVWFSVYWSILGFVKFTT